MRLSSIPTACACWLATALFNPVQFAIDKRQSSTNLANNLLYLEASPSPHVGSQCLELLSIGAPPEVDAIAKAKLISSFDGTGVNP